MLTASETNAASAPRPLPWPIAASPIVGLLVIAVFALAWIDVLPGGWRLRELFSPHTERETRATLRHAAERIAFFQRENPSVAPNSIVFFGSSTIERLPLAEIFPDKATVNRGIVSASATLLASVLDRCLPAARPSGVVLYAGAIDWRASSRDNDIAVDHVAWLLEKLERSLPGVPVALLGVLPERHLDAASVARLAALNEKLAHLAHEHGFEFVATARPPIASPSGALSEELSVDDFHLDARGYRILARWIIEDGGPVGRCLDAP